MKIEHTRRFNKKIKGSYEVAVWLKDWECSILIGALKHYAKYGRSIRTNKPLPKATITFVERHLQKGISEALGTVLKAEFDDLRESGHPYYAKSKA